MAMCLRYSDVQRRPGGEAMVQQNIVKMCELSRCGGERAARVPLRLERLCGRVSLGENLPF